MYHRMRAPNNSENPPTPRAAALATLALIAAAILWSLSGVAIKSLSGTPTPSSRPSTTGLPTGTAPTAALPPGAMHPLTLACYRSLLGGLILLPLAWRQRQTLANVAPRWPLLGVAAFTLMSATFVIANTLVTAADAILLQYTSPVWVFLLAPALLRERPTRVDIVLLILTMAGIAVIFSGSNESGTGLLIAIISGFGYGAVTVFSRVLRPVSAVVVTTCYALGSGLLLLPAVLLLNIHAISAPQFGWLAVLGLLQFTLPYLLFAWALQRTTATRASLITLLETVLNPFWTWLFLNEHPPVATLLGAPLILSGVLLKIAWRPRA